MSTITVHQGITSPSGRIDYSNDYTASGTVEVSESVADSSTDAQINVAIDFSALGALLIVSDQDVTLETNNGTTPDDTFSLLANKPLIWFSDSYFDCPLTVDVTAVFITNSSGSTATITIRANQDATP